MNRQRVMILGLVCLCFFWANIVMAENKPASGKNNFSANQDKKWYSLQKDEQYVDSFTLKSGETKLVTINAHKETLVWLKINISGEKLTKYSKKTSKFPNFPIKLSQKGRTDLSYGVMPGGGMEFRPINGKIVLAASNSSGEDFQILIYLKPKWPPKWFQEKRK